MIQNHSNAYVLPLHVKYIFFYFITSGYIWINLCMCLHIYMYVSLCFVNILLLNFFLPHQRTKFLGLWSRSLADFSCRTQGLLWFSSRHVIGRHISSLVVSCQLFFSAPLTRLFWIYISKKYFDNLYFTCMLWTLKVSPEMLQPENLNEAEWSWYNHGEWPGLEA